MSTARGVAGVIVGVFISSTALGIAATINVPGDYPTIQAAINAANPGDTIRVAAGTYTLTGTISVTKSLTILGAQASVDPRPSVGGRTGPETLLKSSTTVFDIQAHNVEINGFRIECTINNPNLNIIQDNRTDFTSQNAKVTHNIITNTGTAMNEAIKIRVGSRPEIAYNYIYNIPSPGDAINFDRVTDGLIAYNEVWNSGSENAAIYVYASTGTRIIGNIIDTTTQNDGIKLGSKDGSDATESGGVIAFNIVRNTAQDGISVYMSGVRVEGNRVTGSRSENGAIYLAYGIRNITICYNEIVDNTLRTHKWGNPGGITIGSAVNVSTVDIYGNTITGNTPTDVANFATGAPLLDATGNWWGQETGPRSGQIVGNVAYSPWLGNHPSQPRWTFIVAKVGPELPAGYLQTGLDTARPGDIVLVKAGEYVTQGLISKGIVLQGEPGAVIKAPGSQKYTIAESTARFDPIIFAYGGTLVGSHVSGTAVISADVKDLTIDGQNKAPAAPVRFVGILYRNVKGTISGNTIGNLYDADGKGDGPQTFGILVYGDSEVNVLGNVVSGFSRGGIGIMGDMGPAPDPVANVSGNVVVGNGLETGTGWWAENGIQFGYGARGVISGNFVTQCWVNSPHWTATGILVVSTDNVTVQGNSVVANQSGIGVVGYGPWGWPSANANTVRENDVFGSDWGIIVQMDANNTMILYNNVRGSTYAGISVADFYGFEPTGTMIRFNRIVGNGLGVENWEVGSNVDAALNWWGSPAGPTHATNPGGGGDAVSNNVIYSPWLGSDPDGNPTAPGVQVTGPVLIIVDDVGPAPAGGYLNTAIEGANTLPYADTIQVREGTYDASAAVTGATTVVSCASCPNAPRLSGTMTLGSAGILIGRMGQGFTILGNINVSAGVDASTIHINWNDLFGTVTNNGLGTLDATYNWWGGRHPGTATVGSVNYYPYLPLPVCDMLTYMSRHRVDADTAIFLIERGRLVSEGLLVLSLMRRFGLGQDEAEKVLDEFGFLRVGNAFDRSADYDEFVRLLLGFRTSSLGVADTYKVGEPIVISLGLTDFQGKPVLSLAAWITLIQIHADGRQTIWRWGAAQYDPDTGLLEFSISTAGLPPGNYELVIGFKDGSHEKLRTQLVLEN